MQEAAALRFEEAFKQAKLESAVTAGRL